MTMESNPRKSLADRMKNTQIHNSGHSGILAMRLLRMAVRVTAALALTTLPLQLSGCGPTATDRDLDRAEALLEERPDSAFSIVMSMDSMTRSRNPRARILEYEARYMMDIHPIIPDREHIDIDDMDLDGFIRMKAYYLKGYDSYIKGDMESAVLNSLHAENAAEEEGPLCSPLWKARIYQLLGMSYSGTCYFIKAAEYFDKAKNMFGKAGKKVNAIYNDLDKILCLSGLSADPETTDSLVILAEKIHEQNGEFFSDIRLKNYWHYAYAAPLLKTDDIGKLRKCLDFWNSDSCTMSDNPKLLSMKAKAMSRLGLDLAARQLADSLVRPGIDPYSRIMAYETLASCWMKDGDTGKYLECKDSISGIRDRQAGVIIGQSNLDIQNRFNEEAARKAAESERRADERLRTLAMICGLMIIVTVFILLAIRKRNSLRLKEMFSELIVMKDDLNRIKEELTSSRRESETVGRSLEEARLAAMREKEDNQKKESGYRQRIKQLEETSGKGSSLAELSSLFSEQIATINSLCENLIETPRSDLSDMKSMQVISDLFDSLRNPDFIKIVETRVDLTKNGLISRLREQCSGFLTSDDMDFYILTASGMKYRTVSTIQNKSQSSYSKRKFRLKEKLTKNNPKNLNEFISYL